MYEFSVDEREYLLHMLEDAHTALLRELHHTDAQSFRQHLRDLLEVNESIMEKVQNVREPALVGR